MTRTRALIGLTAALASLSFAASASAANPTQLLLPQSTAFSILGHSCGGIQEQAYATGFDPLSSLPTGDVYLQTRCGGSGRGGGYHTTTYSAWVSVTWAWTGAVVSYTKLTAAPAVDPTLSAFDSTGDQVYNSGTRAYLNVVVPAAPTGVTAGASGGQYQVSWVPDPAAAAQMTSSTVTATPVGSPTPAVTATASGTSSTALIGPLQPLTTYDITVVSTDAGGSSPASSPVTITTPSASIPPAAPTAVTGRWTAPGSPGDTLVATWGAAAPGDTPTDQYQVTVTGSDGGGTFTQTVSGSTLSATFAVSDGPDWTITVRAHNAAGWGPWSAPGFLGGA